MAVLRDIRKRIRSLKASQKITRAMQMVAAAKLRRAQEALIRAEPFVARSAALAQRLAAYERGRASSGAWPALAEQAPGAPLWLVLGSDRGLCGAFNAQLLRWLEWSFAKAPAAQHQVAAMGRKVREPLARRAGVQLLAVPGGLGSWADVAALARAMLQQAMAGGPAPRPLFVVYNHFTNIMRQAPACLQVWPLAAAPLAPGPAAPNGDGGELLVEPACAQAALGVVRQAVAAALWQASLGSQASEQGARMTAMDAATSNARDLMDALTLQYNRARQAAITRDLMDIVGGAEALAGG